MPSRGVSVAWFLACLALVTAPEIALVRRRVNRTSPGRKGAAIGKLGDIAQIRIPEGYRFAGRDGVRRFDGAHSEIRFRAKSLASWFLLAVRTTRHGSYFRVQPDRIRERRREGTTRRRRHSQIAARRKRARQRRASEARVVDARSPGLEHPHATIRSRTT